MDPVTSNSTICFRPHLRPIFFCRVQYFSGRLAQGMPSGRFRLLVPTLPYARLFVVFQSSICLEKNAMPYSGTTSKFAACHSRFCHVSTAWLGPSLQSQCFELSVKAAASMVHSLCGVGCTVHGGGSPPGSTLDPGGCTTRTAGAPPCTLEGLGSRVRPACLQGARSRPDHAPCRIESMIRASTVTPTPWII